MGEIEIGESEFGPNQLSIEWVSGIANDMVRKVNAENCQKRKAEIDTY